MEITGEYRIPASRERVFEALNDPDVLARCIPGCEHIEKRSESAMQARIKAAIGPVRATFDTALTLADLEPPSRYTLSGEAKAGASGFGRGSARVVLDDDDGDTRLTYDADFKVGGRLAQVGARLVTGATRKTADEFFGNLARELGAGAEAPGEDTAAAGGTRWRKPAAVGIAVLLILLVLASVLSHQ